MIPFQLREYAPVTDGEPVFKSWLRGFTVPEYWLWASVWESSSIQPPPLVSISQYTE
jgi:hypothetical protein